MHRIYAIVEMMSKQEGNMSEQTGVLRWQQDHLLGIAADDSISGATMHLKSIDDEFSKWDVDKDKGSI
jgi:hypothetical protein